jgi:hypothetical protein
MADIVQRDVIRIAWEEADEGDRTSWSYAITAEVEPPDPEPYPPSEFRFSVGESEASWSRLEIYASDIPRYIELLQAVQEYIDAHEVTDENPV